MGIQGWPLKFVQHVADATCVSRYPAGPPGSWHLHILHLSNLSFMIGLELRANQCFLCKFYSVPRCKGQIAQNLNLNSLLVKREIDNPSPGAVTGGN